MDHELDGEGSIARQLWLATEPLHAVTYFAPEGAQAWEAAGGRGFWRGYFAMRAAPFGAVGPSVVTAAFYNFAPTTVARALPSVWQMVTPDAALVARRQGAAAALRRVLGAALEEATVAAVVSELRPALGSTSVAGRPLFAVNAALPWPDDPVEALWHALTCLREHRGDGHNAALVAAGLDGIEAHLVAGTVGAGGADVALRLAARGWTSDDLQVAQARLVARGLLLVDDGGRAGVTDAGRALHAEVEARTDIAAMAPWERLGRDRTARLLGVLAPWADTLGRSELLRHPNPMGLPPPVA